MTQVKKGDTVKVHYTGKFEDGTVFDSSTDGEPLEFTLGEGQLIPGFENAVEGMKVGDTKTATFPPDQAYGPRHEEMVIEVDRSEFPEDLDLEVGQQLQLEQPNGDTLIVMVADVSGPNVILDANHPLAGQDLTFEIELIEVA